MKRDGGGKECKIEQCKTKSLVHLFFQGLKAWLLKARGDNCKGLTMGILIKSRFLSRKQHLRCTIDTTYTLRI